MLKREDLHRPRSDFSIFTRMVKDRAFRKGFKAKTPIFNCCLKGKSHTAGIESIKQVSFFPSLRAED